MKFVYACLLCTFACLSPMAAQQEMMFTQFYQNKLYYNPAFAATSPSPILNLAHRSQWIGIEGAPTSTMLGYQQPLLGQNLGLGLNLGMTKAAITRVFNGDLSYSYKFKVNKGELYTGLRISIRQYSMNWSDSRLIASDQIQTDNAIPQEAQNKLTVNFGAGFYFRSGNEQWYISGAAHRLARSSFDNADFGSELSREAIHLNMMGGFVLEPAAKIDIEPQILLRYAFYAPLDLDFNVMADYDNKFYLGLTYRTGGDVRGFGESVDVISGIQASKSLYIGLSYDIGLTRLRKFNNGTVEAAIRYIINPPDQGEVQNPIGF